MELSIATIYSTGHKQPHFIQNLHKQQTKYFTVMSAGSHGMSEIQCRIVDLLLR